MMDFSSAFHTFGNKFALIIESFCQLRYKNKNLFSLIVLFIIGNVLYIAYANMRLIHWDIFRRSADGDLYEGSTDNADGVTVPDHHRRRTTDLQVYPKILLFLSSSGSNLGKSIGNLLKSVGFVYSQFVWGSGSIRPHLTPHGPALLVFEKYRNYLTLPPRRRNMIDRYCQEFGVGIIGFVTTEHNGLGLNSTLEHGLYAHPVHVLEDAVLNETSPVLRIAKPSGTIPGPLPGGIQTVFSYDNASRYSAVLTALERHYINDHVSVQHNRTVVVQDLGDGLNGVEKLLIGGPALLDFWLFRVLFLDAVSLLTSGAMILELKRYILVDIDDIFISSPGIGITPADVQALVDGQKRIRRLIPDFTFNLGFCGRFLHSGSDQQRAGADALLAVVDEFWWFPHTWDHIQPHKSNYSRLVASMRRNKQFANDHGISVRHGYSVAPHHSGVYPVDQQLYTAWKQVWDIHQTSTEEYPHLYEPGGRRGFIHNGVRVMPRQTCGLFTHTVFLDKYPNGKHVLEEKIRGGEIFQTILANPISIFMTHQPNYVGDRLALYTMEAAARFIQHWTNLQLHTAPPDQLADLFFNKFFPDQRKPLWGNPCLDRRHVDIWRLSDVCGESGGSAVFPRLLILGPQKTGSTALHSFLAADPRLKANRPSDTGTFEELQFFSGRNYDRGVDWYLSNFMGVGDNGTLLFEKSATYFDSADAPRRAAALLPDAKLVVILVDPSRRAYSWYQHQRSHSDPIATNNSFFRVITADGHHTPLSRLRNRCLDPGKYAVHLENWLQHFRPSQIHAVDGETLRTSPVQEMHLLQDFLEIPSGDFSKLIKYSSKKGYFCPVNVETGTTRCLGVSKGRRYKLMDTDSAEFLKNYYSEYNVRLHELLTRLGWPSPEWLLQLMKASSSHSSSTSVHTYA